VLKLNAARVRKRAFHTAHCLIVLGVYENEGDAETIMSRAREIGAVTRRGKMEVYVLDLKNTRYPYLGVRTYSESTLREIVQFELSNVTVSS
jgi:hypothetical protein